MRTPPRAPSMSSRRRSAAAALLVLWVAAGGCADDGPAAYRTAGPIAVDVRAEAASANDGTLYEFVVDAAGYVSVPSSLPAGPVTVTLTYEGDRPAPHSLVFEGINGDQPIVAVDLPGSNNGTVALPPGPHVFFDGAPGNRDAGYEGRLVVADAAPADQPAAAGTVVAWKTSGLRFVDAPEISVPADSPLIFSLDVSDRLPHSIALVGVRGEQPLVAVDGPGENQRTIELPPGTYTYFCAVPGHREAGMEGILRVG